MKNMFKRIWLSHLKARKNKNKMGLVRLNNKKFIKRCVD
jgi:hypothetical protein